MGKRLCGIKFDKGIGIGAILAKRKGIDRDTYIKWCSKLSKKALITLLSGL